MSSYLLSCIEKISPCLAFWYLNQNGILHSSSHTLILFFTAHWSLNGKLCNFSHALYKCIVSVSLWSKEYLICSCCSERLHNTLNNQHITELSTWQSLMHAHQSQCFRHDHTYMAYPSLVTYVQLMYIGRCTFLC